MRKLFTITNLLMVLLVVNAMKFGMDIIDGGDSEWSEPTEGTYGTADVDTTSVVKKKIESYEERH